MNEYLFTNPDNGDQIVLHLEYVTEIGVYRVYIEGDNGQKPLFSGSNQRQAQTVFDDVKAAMEARTAHA